MTVLSERDFIEHLRAAEMHWFFVQARKAAAVELWLPAVVALLTGIENSVRVTVRQMKGQDLPGDPELGATLSNALLRQAMELGLPVAKLAFPDERDFAAKLSGRTPYVEIVRARHNLCHGNVLEWVNRELGQENAFFTPECLRPLTGILLEVASVWVVALGAFRREKGLCSG